MLHSKQHLLCRYICMIGSVVSKSEAGTLLIDVSPPGFTGYDILLLTQYWKACVTQDILGLVVLAHLQRTPYTDHRDLTCQQYHHNG